MKPFLVRTIRACPLTSVLLVLTTVATLVAAVTHGQGEVAYGLPALRSGAWWRFLAGAFVVPTLALLPVVLALLGVALGTLERRLGSRRALGVVAVTHLAGSAGAALVLAGGSVLPWPWAHGVASLSDTGLSTAGVGAVAVLSTTMKPAAGRAVRGVVGAYLVVMLLTSGLLWDLEHLIAFAAGLLLAGVRCPAPVRDEVSAIRGLAALLVAGLGTSTLVQASYMGYGGVFGSGPGGASGVLPGPAVAVCVVAFVLADGLRRGRPWSWRMAGIGSVVLMVGAGLPTGTLACLAALLVLVIAHLRVSTRERLRSHPVDIRTRLARDGGGTLGWQHTWSGASTWVSDDDAVAITYRESAGVAIVIADPVGPVGSWPDAVAGFETYCRRCGITPAWYAVSARFVDVTRSADRAVAIGTDTVLALPELRMRGKAWQDVRTARNRAAREGIELRRINLRTGDPGVVAQVHEVSRGWVADKALPEMGFTLGGLQEALDPAVRTYVAIDGDGVVHGVTSWLPVHRDDRIVGWTLDLMRRRDGGFRPVMEFLIAECLIAFQDEGFAFASLSVAPLATIAAERTGVVDRVLRGAGGLLEPVYGFGSLLRFKAKFSPQLEPVYLAYENPFDLPRIAYAIGHAYVPHLGVRETARVVQATWNDRLDRPKEKPSISVSTGADSSRVAPSVTNSGV